jgi:predicted metal-dependent hydrolase
MDTSRLKYISAYSEEIQSQVLRLIEQNKLAQILLNRYPEQHQTRTDSALYKYTQDLKNTFLGNSDPITKVEFDNKIHVINHALGMHTAISRVQGSKLKAKREIRVATIFKDGPQEFLKMIVVHELAHLKIKEHSKAFYKLCTHIEPSYHQYEFDLRLYLTWLDSGGPRLWDGNIHNRD